MSNYCKSEQQLTRVYRNVKINIVWTITDIAKVKNTVCKNMHSIQYLYSYSIKATWVFYCWYVILVTRHLQ